MFNLNVLKLWNVKRKNKCSENPSFGFSVTRVKNYFNPDPFEQVTQFIG